MVNSFHILEVEYIYNRSAQQASQTCLKWPVCLKMDAQTRFRVCYGTLGLSAFSGTSCQLAFWRDVTEWKTIHTILLELYGIKIFGSVQSGKRGATMPEKYDPDSSPGVKLLRAFRKLLLNNRKHYQTDLARELNCSPQTVIRIMQDIEAVIGANLQSGITNRRKWYSIDSQNSRALGLDYEELRYLSVCRNLAAPILPTEIIARVDDTIFNLSMRMKEKELARAEHPVMTFFSKGHIDYSGYFPLLDLLLEAIQSSRLCDVEYKALGKRQSRRHFFLPYKLLAMNQVLYIVGATFNEQKEKRHNFINFALHRIKSIVPCEESVSVKFPPLAPEAFGLPWHEPKLYRMHFKKGKAADYVAERIWSEPQKMVRKADGSLMLELLTNSVPELQAWARSFGDELIGMEEAMAKKAGDQN